MASINVALVYLAGANAPVVRSEARTSEVVTSSAASAQSTAIAQDNEYWEISAPSNIMVTFGTNPTATAANTFRVWGGQTRHFKAKAGDKCAVIDA